LGLAWLQLSFEFVVSQQLAYLRVFIVDENEYRFKGSFGRKLAMGLLCRAPIVVNVEIGNKDLEAAGKTYLHKTLYCKKVLQTPFLGS